MKTKPKKLPPPLPKFAVHDGRCAYCGHQDAVGQEFYVLHCPTCGRVGCPECMPAGRGCECPECEESMEL
jgi:hypothetical protein